LALGQSQLLDVVVHQLLPGHRPPENDCGTGPDLQGEIRWSYNLPRQSFTKARIGTNFGTSPWDTAYTYAPPAKPVKSAVYTGIRLTSYSGHKDDLSSWWMHHKLLALADRNLVAFPDNLAGGGASFHTWFAPKSAQSSS